MIETMALISAIIIALFLMIVGMVTLLALFGMVLEAWRLTREHDADT